MITSDTGDADKEAVVMRSSYGNGGSPGSFCAVRR